MVFLGGGLGSGLRHLVNLVGARLLPGSFPFATLAINVVGSLAMGMIVAWMATRVGLPRHHQLFLTTGILGGFTTFSTFSLESAVLHERGQTGLAVLYVVASVGLGIAALFLGMALVRGAR